MRTCRAPAWLDRLAGGAVEVAIFGRTRVARSWSLRDRVVPEHYVVGVVEGAAEVAAGGRRAVLRPGACAWFQPRVAHTIRPLDPNRGFRFFHLRFRLRSGGAEWRTPDDALLLPDARPLLPQLEALRHEHASGLPHREVRFRALLVALLADLLRLGDPARADTLDGDQRRRVLALASTRLPGPLHPRELAAAAGLSHDWFARRFRRTFGLAPRAWLLRERLRAVAARVAEGDEPMAAIAAACGFGSPYVFSRQFRRVLGVAPTAWRAARRGR